MMPRFVYSIIKQKQPRKGFSAPVSVEWNIVSNKFLNKLYIKKRTIFRKIFKFLSLIGDRFPSFASQVIIRVER
jgi:hypothetical protein